MGLETIERISHKYGGDSRYVLAGGGNTSYKDSDCLYVKGSGTSLATIKQGDFVKMSRQSLAKIWDKKYSEEQSKREAQVLCDMMASRCIGEESKREVGSTCAGGDNKRRQNSQQRQNSGS